MTSEPIPGETGKELYARLADEADRAIAARATSDSAPAGDTPRSAVVEVGLLPCPFCGEQDEFTPDLTTIQKYAEPGDPETGTVGNPAAGLIDSGWLVECCKCSACGAPSETRANAIAAWNTRASSEAVEQSEVSRLREAGGNTAPTITVSSGPCNHQWGYAPTVGNVTCVRCNERREWDSPEATAVHAMYEALNGGAS